MNVRFAMAPIVWLVCAGMAVAAPAPAEQQATQTSATKKAAAPSSVDLSKLPAPVRSTIEAQTQNATVKHVSKETEKGAVQYEVETIVNGKSRDLLVDPSGTLLEVEEGIDLAAAPPPVQEALRARGKVLKLETVQRGGTTAYEAQVQGKSGKKSSVTLDPQGKPAKG